MVTPPLFAHRLGRAYGPDSSASALSGALAAGAEGLETDVCLTADGELVLLHDPLLQIGTTLDGWARERSLAEIRGAFILDRDRRPTGEHPLALADLLASVPDDVLLQLEVKAHADPELARRTAEAICERCRRDPARSRIELISFHSDAVAIAAARGFATRLVTWADYAPDALATWARRRGIGGVSAEHFLLSESFVRVLRLAGLSISTGTVNDAELLLRIADRVDGVCTDRPAELRAEAEALAADEAGAPAEAVRPTALAPTSSALAPAPA